MPTVAPEIVFTDAAARDPVRPDRLQRGAIARDGLKTGGSAAEGSGQRRDRRRAVGAHRLGLAAHGLRSASIGAALVPRAEEEAVRRGCRGAWLDTFSFQARGFYEHLGYRGFGTIADQPPGHARHFLQKPLAPAADRAPPPAKERPS